MSNLGDEMSSAGLSVMNSATTKLLGIITEISKGVFQTILERTSAEYKLNQEQLKITRNRLPKGAERKTSLANYADLIRSGSPLTAIGPKMTREQFKDFYARCKSEGIVITGLEDTRDRASPGKRQYIVMCKIEDRHKAEALAALINEEHRIEGSKKGFAQGRLNEYQDRIKKRKESPAFRQFDKTSVDNHIRFQRDEGR
ncbi:MAG: hypothetical protein LBB94_13190 [Clostridiales bacterium]|jgi:hypothetical protein|nr:hypothetical protein [Clostridiales bacterium]